MNQQEIAEHFGISQSTVSIALSHVSTNRVSKKLRKAIWEYCREHAPDYLRTVKHWNVGFAAFDNYCQTPFYAELKDEDGLWAVVFLILQAGKI